MASRDGLGAPHCSAATRDELREIALSTCRLVTIGCTSDSLQFGRILDVLDGRSLQVVETPSEIRCGARLPTWFFSRAPVQYLVGAAHFVATAGRIHVPL